MLKRRIEQFQVDWGYFGSITYGNTTRRLYGLAVVEPHSRMMYVEFTHSRKQQVLHQCLVNAFRFFRGTPKEIVVDNTITTVIERRGSSIRYNEMFLDFLSHFSIIPNASNVVASYRKEGVETSIRYIKQKFLPLKKSGSLLEVQAQAMQWLNETANVRIQKSSGECPADSFCGESLRVLPEFIPDCRETEYFFADKDFTVKFDGSYYTTPPWTIDKFLRVKADNKQVIIYDKKKIAATYDRCWERKKRIGTTLWIK